MERQRLGASSGLIVIVLLGATFVPAAAGEEAWRAKLGDDLRRWLHAHPDAAAVELIAWGGPVGEPTTPPADRAAWLAFFERASLPLRSAVESVARSEGGVVLAAFAAGNGVKLSIPVAALEALASIPAVVTLGIDGPEEVVAANAAPGEPGATLDGSVPLTQAPELWAAGYRGEGIVIAILDSGIDDDHPVFLDPEGHTRVAGWTDVTASPGCATPCDANGHGTLVASVLAGGKAGGGLHDGVAPGALLHGIKIFPNASSGGTWEQAIRGLEAVLEEPGIDVAMNAWGGACSGGGLTARETAENLVRAGVETFFSIGAGGPRGGTISCPADGELVIGAGATDDALRVAGFSSRGPCSGGRLCPDLVAPGVNVVAAQSGGGYRSVSGTSFSAAMTAGAAALLEQANRDLFGKDLDAAAGEIDRALKATARDLGVAGPDNDAGWGFLQVNDAYGYLAGFAVLVPSMSLALDRAELRDGQSFEAALSVAVSGTVSADFDAKVVIDERGANSLVSTLAGRLAAGSAVKATSRGVVSGLDPGDYSVGARTVFTFLHPGTGKVVKLGMGKEAPLTVRGVKMLADASFGKAEAGAQIKVAPRVVNVGNEPATAVTVEATIPAGFVPYPSASPRHVQDKAPKRFLAEPEPTDVRVNPDGSLVYSWTGLTIAAGAGFEASLGVATTKAGDFTVVVSGSYTDGAGARGTYSGSSTLTVLPGKVPQPPAPPG